MLFRQRHKKYYPSETFIALPLRIAAILHLCLAFSFTAYTVSQPFMGDLFAIKSNVILYEDVMGIREGADRLRMANNEERFKKMPIETQMTLKRNYQILQKKLTIPFAEKCSQSCKLLVFSLTVYEKIWLLLSISLPILLLKKIEGAANALWLLPLVTLLFSIDNRMFTPAVQPSEEERLFPTEQVLLQEYLQEPLQASVFAQKEQLKRAWQLYLIKVWGKQAPEAQLNERQKQEEAGEFAFTVARLLSKSSISLPSTQQPHRQSLLILGIYLAWNMFMALLGNMPKWYTFRLLNHKSYRRPASC